MLSNKRKGQFDEVAQVPIILVSYNYGRITDEGCRDVFATYILKPKDEIKEKTEKVSDFGYRYESRPYKHFEIVGVRSQSNDKIIASSAESFYGEHSFIAYCYENLKYNKNSIQFYFDWALRGIGFIQLENCFVFINNNKTITIFNLPNIDTFSNQYQVVSLKQKFKHNERLDCFNAINKDSFAVGANYLYKHSIIYIYSTSSCSLINRIECQDYIFSLEAISALNNCQIVYGGQTYRGKASKSLSIYDLKSNSLVKEFGYGNVKNMSVLPSGNLAVDDGSFIRIYNPENECLISFFLPSKKIKSSIELLNECKQREEFKVKSMSKIIGQGLRSHACLFRKLSLEITAKVASFLGGEVFSSKEIELLACKDLRNLHLKNRVKPG